MIVLLTSPLGDPARAETWSNAPANLARALRDLGVGVETFDSGAYGASFRSVQGMRNLLQGYPWNAVAWFAPARRLRARKVAEEARNRQADVVLCTSTLDAPVGTGVRYCLWIDNTWRLLGRSAVSPGFSAAAASEVDRLERLALQGACHVFTFSRHVRDSVLRDYGVSPGRATAVGCGSGPLPPQTGNKRFADGHLLFVAKHLFAEKGGDLVLSAFPTIRRARPQTRLVLVGNRDAAQRAKGMEGVEVHGYIPRETLNALFHGAAMLVQPMIADPWGQVYLEAMKARAVVVSLRVGALPELTEDGRLGVLVDEPDADALARAVLDTYARGEAALDTMTRQAQARVLATFEWPAVARRILDGLHRAVAATPSATGCGEMAR